MVGAYRNDQSWIGGTSPALDAGLRAPAARALLVGLMDDLVAFADDDVLDAVTQAAVLHAQFEAHPSPSATEEKTGR